MITLRKIVKIWVGFFSLILLLSTLLFAGGEKAVSPALPDAQKEFDQNGPKASSSDSPIFSPMPPSKEKTGYLNPLIPPPLNIQEEPNTGG
jgi:hypothetical protein